MAAKRHMDIKRNITGHNIIIADITGYSLKRFLLVYRRRNGDDSGYNRKVHMEKHQI